MEGGSSDPQPMVDPAALDEVARAGAQDRARREELAKHSRRPPKATPVDSYGERIDRQASVFTWANYGLVWFAFWLVAGLLLIGKHPVVAAIVLSWSALYWAVVVAALLRRRRAKRRATVGRRGLN